MGDGRLAGVEVAASFDGDYLGAERFGDFWAAAEETEALVFIHPTTRGFDQPVFDDYYLWNAVGNPLETTVTAAHMVMAGVLERHPGLRVLLAHGGGALPALRGRLRHAHSFQPQARSSLGESPDDSLGRFYFDTVTHDESVLRELVALTGADRVLCGAPTTPSTWASSVPPRSSARSNWHPTRSGQLSVGTRYGSSVRSARLERARRARLGRRCGASAAAQLEADRAAEVDKLLLAELRVSRSQRASPAASESQAIAWDHSRARRSRPRNGRSPSSPDPRRGSGSRAP